MNIDLDIASIQRNIQEQLTEEPDLMETFDDVTVIGEEVFLSINGNIIARRNYRRFILAGAEA